MITVKTKHQKQFVKTWVNNYSEKHVQYIEITTVCFLFIPIYKRIKVLKSNI